MLLSEIAEQTEWDPSDLGNVTLFVPLFEDHVPFVLFPAPDATVEVTEKMAATINEVLRLDAGHIEKVKALLWEEANFAFQVADYGVEAEEGETNLQAHLREFGIANADDALAKSRIRAIHVFDEFFGRYAELKINTGSENYIGIIVKNGQIIDFDDDGTHLGWFDEDEQFAHNKRKKVLA